MAFYTCIRTTGLNLLFLILLAYLCKVLQGGYRGTQSRDSISGHGREAWRPRGPTGSCSSSWPASRTLKDSFRTNIGGPFQAQLAQEMLSIPHGDVQYSRLSSRSPPGWQRTHARAQTRNGRNSDPRVLRKGHGCVLLLGHFCNPQNASGCFWGIFVTPRMPQVALGALL